jgi:hypothetical protein
MFMCGCEESKPYDHLFSKVFSPKLHHYRVPEDKDSRVKHMIYKILWRIFSLADLTIQNRLSNPSSGFYDNILYFELLIEWVTSIIFNTHASPVESRHYMISILQENKIIRLSNLHKLSRFSTWCQDSHVGSLAHAPSDKYSVPSRLQGIVHQ